MTHKFRYRCSRRSDPRTSLPAPVPALKPFGAGSGGGPVEIGEMDVDVPSDDDGGFVQHHDGTYAMHANRVEFVSRMPIMPANPLPYLISLFAAGTGDDGQVQVRGSKGVRITTGPPPLPPSASDSTNGFEVVVGEEQSVTIQRGLIPEVDQLISMTEGAILIDGGEGSVTIQSLTSITLQVADGASSITMTPTGIIIQGLMVAIN